MRVIGRRSTLLKIAIIMFAGTMALAVFVSNDRQKVLAASDGPSPGFTGARDESDCTACHTSYEINSGGGSVQINGIPHDYIPGQQYQISVTTAHEGAVYYGFELTAIDPSGGRVGTFTLPTEPGGATMQIKPDFSYGRDYVEHTSYGLYSHVGVFGSNTWTFTWTAPALRKGKIDFYAAGNGANSNGTPYGDYIYTTSRSALSGSAIANFDGDVSSDIAYYTPRTGTWSSYSIQNNTTQTFSLGSQTSRITPGDFDGDGKTDFAVFQSTPGKWLIQRSTLGYIETLFGQAGDIPVAGDYDGDGKTDLAVFRPATGTWLVKYASGGTTSVTLGQNGDKPVPGDYDGDGKTDFGVFRPSDGTWLLNRSLLGATSIQYGAAADRPVPADYDGDGKTDIAYFHPATGSWNLNRSSAGAISIQLGNSRAIPAPADYDGDGKADVAVFDPFGQKRLGVWHILRSSDLTTYDQVLGSQRDVPVASGYIAQ